MFLLDLIFFKAMEKIRLIRYIGFEASCRYLTFNLHSGRLDRRLTNEKR